MKLLLSAVGVLMATGLCAQDFQPDISQLIAQSKLFKSNADTIKPRVFPRTLDLNMLGSKVVKPTPGVYALPQDGMPCIVPDTDGIAAMPNAAKATGVPPPNRMPNAAPNQRLLPPPRSWSK